jgi:hypothetical protein
MYDTPGYHGQYMQPPQQKKKSKLPVILISVLVGVLVLCGGGVALTLAAGGAAVNEVANDIETKKQGVSIKKGTCKASEFGGYEVVVVMKNNTDSKQSFWVQVDLMDADKTTRLGEAHAIANDLPPGATTEVPTSGNGDFKKGAYCDIRDIK